MSRRLKNCKLLRKSLFAIVYIFIYIFRVGDQTEYTDVYTQAIRKATSFV